MKHEKSVRTFENKGVVVSSTVHDLVLMDGGYVCFAARLNSRLKERARSTKFEPGSIITVNEHALVWMWTERTTDFRMVMLLSDFDLKPPAKPDLEAERKGENATGLSAIDACHVDKFDTDVLVDVMMTKDIVFQNYSTCGNFDHGYSWTFLSKDKARKGYWIEDKLVRSKWLEVIRDRKRKAEAIDSDSWSIGMETCKCQECFGLNSCVLTEFPLEGCDRKDTFDLARDRLGEDAVEAESFDDLANNHKRWCLYYFYAVNIFNVYGSIGEKHKTRKRLPICFVRKVRDIYPAPAGEVYTGHKDT